MSITSLVEQGINNPPVDGDLPVATSGAVDGMAAQARKEAFLKMSDTNETDEGGARFGMDAINASNSEALHARLKAETIARNRAELQAIEMQVMDSQMTPEAAYSTIKDLRSEVAAGTYPEDLAVAELSAKNIQIAEEYNQQDIALQQALEDVEKYKTSNMLAALRSQIEDDMEATIPGVEDAYEWLVSGFMFPKSGGYNVAGLLEDTLGVDIGFFRSLAPGDQIIEAQKMWTNMTGEQRAAAIKRARSSINSRAGILFDNEEDAMIMLNALEAVAGSRVQAESSRVAGTTGQYIDGILTVATGGTLKAVKAGINKLKGASKIPTDKVDIDLGGPTGKVDIDLGGPTQKPDIDLGGPTQKPDIDLGGPTQKPDIDLGGPTGKVDIDLGGPTRKPDIDLGDIPSRVPDIDLGPTIKPDIDLGPSKSNIDIDVGYIPSRVPDIDLGPTIKPDIDLGSIREPYTGVPFASPAQMLNDVAPKVAAPILSDAITDTSGSIAKGLGATRAQIAEDTMAPLVSGGPIRRGASLSAPSITNEISDTGATIINMMHDSRLYTAGELEKVKTDIGKVLSKLTDEDITMVSKSDAFVDEATGKVSMNYVMGAGKGRSFATAKEARAFITRLPSTRLDTFEVLKFNPAKNQYMTYTGDAGDRGEFLLRARYTHTRSSGASKEDVLRSDTANFLINHVDSSVAYVDRVAKGISRLDIRQAQIQGVFKSILKPLEALKSKEALDQVWDTLKAAEKRAEDFSQGQLARKLGGDQAQIEAYRAVRRFNQAIYEVRNLQYRDLLSKRGFLTHTHADGTNGWVKPVTDSSEIKTVWWDEAGGIVSKQALIDKGVELDIVQGFKPRRHVDGEGNISETPYVAIKKGTADLKPLPSQVLYNKKTYLGRHMQAKYVVEEMEDAIVNGVSKKVARIVAVANNPVDAAKESVKSPTRRSRRAIESTETDASYLAQELDQMHDLQMLTNTKHRLDFEQMDVTRQESIVSPSESLDRTRNSMAKSAVLNEWIEYNTNKWTKTYGHLMQNPGFQWGGEIHLKASLAANPDALRSLARARKYRERIQLTTGMHDMQVAERIQQRLLGTGEWLSRAGANVIKRGDANMLRKMQVGTINVAAHSLTKLAEYNVVNKAKALAHLSFIVANPIRQLVMQSTSALMYGGIQHGSKYMASGAAGRDFAFLAMAKSYKDLDKSSFDAIVKKYSKVAGVDKETAERFFKDFEDSGTLGSVSSHQFLEHGFRAGGSYRNHSGTYATDAAPSLARRMGHTVSGSFDTSMRLMSKYGFEAGEKANRLSAYLAVRNKHMVNGTLKDLDATELGMEALRVSGNMGQFNKAAFQSGAIGLPFQFMSYTTRMLQYMTPNTKMTSWIASDVLSGSEKAKIGLWQAAMFGTGGLGVGTMFLDAAKSNGVEVDPMVQNALEEGLAGLGLEALIEGMAGSDANINLSETMGPLSGLTGDLKVVFGKGERAATPLGSMYKVLADMATGMPVNYNDLTGASSGAIGNVYGIVKNIDNIWMNPVLGMGDKLEMQARDIATLLPVVNNVLQARMMAATGEYVSKYGTPVAQVTIAEALSKGLIGVNAQHITDVYELNAELRGRKQTLLAPSHKEVSTSGKDLASWTYNAIQRLNNGQLTKQQVLDKIEAGRASIFMAYEDQTDRDILQASMRKELIRLMGNKETLSDSLVKLMATDLELSEEMGWDKVKTHIGKLGPSEYRSFVLSNIERIQKNEKGSKLRFEAER